VAIIAPSELLKQSPVGRGRARAQPDCGTEADGADRAVREAELHSRSVPAGEAKPVSTAFRPTRVAPTQAHTGPQTPGTEPRKGAVARPNSLASQRLAEH